MYSEQMWIRFLPLLTGVAPIIAVNASYLIGVSAGRLPACFPYFDGCASISATGRYPPASFLFKAVMMPEAVLLAAYWLFSVAWFRALERSAGQSGRGGTAVGVLGAGSALFLILYVTFLGTDEPFYRFMRRFGVYFYFLLAVLAQILLSMKVLRLPAGTYSGAVTRIVKIQLVLSLLPFALGVLNLVLKAILEDSNPSENIIEWLFALMMQSYFILSYFTWRETGFSVSYSVRR
jgi:hypothetical protein